MDLPTESLGSAGIRTNNVCGPLLSSYNVVREASGGAAGSDILASSIRFQLGPHEPAQTRLDEALRPLPLR